MLFNPRVLATFYQYFKNTPRMQSLALITPYKKAEELRNLSGLPRQVDGLCFGKSVSFDLENNDTFGKFRVVETDPVRTWGEEPFTGELVYFLACY
jgi:hypothetical protein